MPFHYDDLAAQRLEHQAEPPYDPRRLAEPDDDTAHTDFVADPDVAEWTATYERANGVAPTHATNDGVHFRNLTTGKIEFLCPHGIVGHDGCDL